MAANNNTEAATAVRDNFSSFLTGPTISVTPLTARLSSQAREEAKEAKCDFVLFTSLKQERKKSGGGLLGKIAGEAAQQGAYSIGSTATSTAGRIAAHTVAGAANAAATSLATSTKVHDEMELKYRLESFAGQVLLDSSGKRKAKSDGEDLLTPLIEAASEKIANIVTK